MNESPSGIINFAERALSLLDEGSFSATYKFAVFLSLMDICIEQTSNKETAPDVITTKQLAHKVIECYWRQTLPFQCQIDIATLKQNTGRQARILTLIQEFQREHKLLSSSNVSATLLHSAAYQKLVRGVEFSLIEMPLPKLQRFAGQNNPFIYNINWSEQISYSQVFDSAGEYQVGFDNRILLQPNVSTYFASLSNLLRPLIKRKWCEKVAKINHLEDALLEAHLFGQSRVATNVVRPFLLEQQSGKCFYCDSPLTAKSEVDHFIPWARHPNDAIENYVLAHGKCNGDKKHHLASRRHLVNWLRRFDQGDISCSLQLFAKENNLLTRPKASQGIAHALYRKLPSGILLWDGIASFVNVNRNDLLECFN